MSMWDSLDDNQIEMNDKPIWTLDLNSSKNESDIKKWLMTELNSLRHEDLQRVEEIQRHYKIFKGVSTERLHRSENRENESDRSAIQRKIVINHLYDLTEQMVSRVSKFKPSIAVMPNNDEYEDKQAAKLAKKLYDHIAREQSLDMKTIDNLRHCKVAGEGYIFVTWDPDIGPIHPKYKELEEKAEELGKTVKELKVPIRDSEGKPITGKDGKGKYFDEPVRVGDVKFEVVRPETLFFQQKRDFSDVQYMFKVDYLHVEEVKKDYPSKSGDIKQYKDEFQDQYNRYFETEQKNKTMVVEFWHPPTKYLKCGRFIKFTPDAILENKEYPYEHGQWPFERITDIDVPGEKHGRSWFINGRQIATQINNITTMGLRNMKWLSSPKWMVPKGAAKLQQLHNNVGIVEFTGPVPPTIATPSVIAPELMNLRNELKQDLQQIQGISGVGRGEPPPGIKAGVALQFLNEMENERMNSFFAKYNDFKRKLAQKTLAVCGQFYEEEDERTIAVFGKNNEYTRLDFEMERVSGSFSVTIQNANAISETKASQIQNIFDIRKEFPGLMSDEQVAEMLDIGQSEKYLSEASAAVRAAEWENDEMLNSKDVVAEEYELHIFHWMNHVTEIQKPGFKSLPEKVKETFKTHILTHEMHMDTIARKNPTYVQQLAQLRQFPLFYTPDNLAPNPIEEPILDPMAEPGAADQDVRADQIKQDVELQADAEIQKNMGLAAPELGQNGGQQ